MSENFKYCNFFAGVIKYNNTRTKLSAFVKRVMFYGKKREEIEEETDNSFMIEKNNGKYQLDLWKVNELILLDAGIRKEHLAVTDLCTCCNPEFLFSHRASGGRRGNLSVILCLV